MKYSIFIWSAIIIITICNAEPIHYENPLIFDRIKIKSWKEQRDFNIIKQDLDFSCGAASIATLLNNFYGQKITEKEVLEKMDKTRECASFADMQRIMPKFGFEAKGYALSFEQLTNLKIPVIVYLKYRKNDHFSVLRGISEETILLADPSLGHISMSKEQFIAAWQTRQTELAGKILAVLPINNSSITRNWDFFTRNPTRQTHFIVIQLKNQKIE